MEKIAKKFALSKPGERITFTPKLFEFGGKLFFHLVPIAAWCKCRMYGKTKKELCLPD